MIVLLLYVVCPWGLDKLLTWTQQGLNTCTSNKMLAWPQQRLWALHRVLWGFSFQARQRRHSSPWPCSQGAQGSNARCRAAQVHVVRRVHLDWLWHFGDGDGLDPIRRPRRHSASVSP